MVSAACSEKSALLMFKTVGNRRCLRHVVIFTASQIVFHRQRPRGDLLQVLLLSSAAMRNPLAFYEDYSGRYVKIVQMGILSFYDWKKCWNCGWVMETNALVPTMAKSEKRRVCEGFAQRKRPVAIFSQASSFRVQGSRGRNHCLASGLWETGRNWQSGDSGTAPIAPHMSWPRGRRQCHPGPVRPPVL